MSSFLALKEIFAAGRPLIDAQLDLAEQVAALRDAATAKGLDWSQLKALMKAQIQDERDDAGDGKRVKRIVEKAEFASAYADMLGLANMNENNFSAASYSEAKGREPVQEMHEFDPETGELTDNQEQPETASEVPAQDGGGTALDESHGDKSNAARPASVDAHVNGGRLAGEVSAEAVTVVGDESGTLTNSHSQASSSQPANSVWEAPSSSPASPARHSDDIDLTIPAFLRRDEGRGYPKREAVEA